MLFRSYHHGLIAIDKAGRLQEIFGRDNLFVELQDHGLQAQHDLRGGDDGVHAQPGRGAMGLPALHRDAQPIAAGHRGAGAVADHAHVLEMGEFGLQGPAAELAQDPQVIETYLGATKK